MVIVIATEPRIYRQAMAAEIQSRRPEDDVVEAEPDQLDDVVARLAPGAVVSSRPARTVAGPGRWLMLYPESADVARVAVGGQSVQVSAPDLQLVLAFLTLASAATP